MARPRTASGGMTTLLDHCIRDVLGKLEALADGGTQNLDPNKVTVHGAESKVPVGVGVRHRSDGEPKKDRVSLYEFYRWQFEYHAEDSKVLRALWLLACDDYEDFRFKADHRIEVRKGEVLENDPKDPGAAERAQAARVIDWYEGKPALYVAAIESKMGALVTEAWVIKARRQHDRNPADGRPLPEFRKWDEDRRAREVAALQAKGKGQKAVAQLLGVDKNTVRRYWPEPQTPIAA